MTPQEAAVKLRTYAQDQRTRDNVSVMVLFFPGYVPGIYKHLQFVPEPEPPLRCSLARVAVSSSSSSESESESESGSDSSDSTSEESSEEEITEK